MIWSKEEVKSGGEREGGYVAREREEERREVLETLPLNAEPKLYLKSKCKLRSYPGHSSNFDVHQSIKRYKL